MGCSVLRRKLHNHPAPQDVVLSAMHETGSTPLSTGLIREDIHDPANELRRIPLPRTWVNKGGKRPQFLTGTDRPHPRCTPTDESLYALCIRRSAYAVRHTLAYFDVPRDTKPPQNRPHGIQKSLLEMVTWQRAWPSLPDSL